MFGTRKKQFGIRVLLEVQEKKILGLLEVNLNIVYFYKNFFHFTKKFLPLLTIHAFFQNILPHLTPSNPHVIFYWFSLADILNYANKINCSFTKKASKFVIKT